jgi:hypothetical protein
MEPGSQGRGGALKDSAFQGVYLMAFGVRITFPRGNPRIPRQIGEAGTKDIVEACPVVRELHVEGAEIHAATLKQVVVDVKLGRG